MRVAELMTKSLITATPDDLIDQSMYEMKLSSIRHLPVVDERFRLIGIVSDRDFLIALGTNTDKNVYVKDIMTTDIVTVKESESALHAIQTLLRLKIGSLPVTCEEGQLIGIVTETDFLRFAEKALS